MEGRRLVKAREAVAALEQKHSTLDAQIIAIKGDIGYQASQLGRSRAR